MKEEAVAAAVGKVEPSDDEEKWRKKKGREGEKDDAAGPTGRWKQDTATAACTVQYELAPNWT